ALSHARRPVDRTENPGWQGARPAGPAEIRRADQRDAGASASHAAVARLDCPGRRRRESMTRNVAAPDRRSGEEARQTRRLPANLASVVPSVYILNAGTVRKYRRQTDRQGRPLR